MSFKNISIFSQRQIEAQLLKSIIGGLTLQFGEKEILNNIQNSIEKISFKNGQKFKKEQKGNSLFVYAKHWKRLAEGDSLEIDDFNLSESKLSFKITKCEYATFYKKIGAEKLGNTLSCCRDLAFLKGFSEDIEMSRSKSILEGGTSCDFVFVDKSLSVNKQ